MIDIRQLSIRCGRCGGYQVLSGFDRRGGRHIYTYRCEDSECDPEDSRTLMEIPGELDEFARRDPEWRTPEDEM